MLFFDQSDIFDQEEVAKVMGEGGGGQTEVRGFLKKEEAMLKVKGKRYEEALKICID